MGGLGFPCIILIASIIITLLIKRYYHRKKAFNIELQDIRIIHKIGSGRFGEVFLGEWGKGYDRKSVALKKLIDEKQKEEFEKEIQILTRLRHVMDRF